MQLTEAHAVATILDGAGEGWIFDSNEAYALPLTPAALDQCVGAGRVFEGTAVRAYRFAPGRKAKRAAPQPASGKRPAAGAAEGAGANAKRPCVPPRVAR